ncbi:MAG: hypothetical protein ACOCVU_05575 [Desulfohalobiaceae bacterium]
MRIITTIVLAISLLLSLAACAGTGTGQKSQGSVYKGPDSATDMRWGNPNN